MSPLHVIWVGSGLGAVIFFALGFVLASFRRSRGAADGARPAELEGRQPVGGEPAEARVAGLERRLAEADQAASRLPELERAAAAAEELRAERGRLRAQLEAVERRAAEALGAARRVPELERAVAAADELRADRARLASRLEAAERKVAQAEAARAALAARVSDELPKTRTAAAELERERALRQRAEAATGEAMETVGRLTRELAELRRAAATRESGLAEQVRGLETRAGRIEALEKVAARAVELEAELARARKEIDALGRVEAEAEAARADSQGAEAELAQARREARELRVELVAARERLSDLDRLSEENQGLREVREERDRLSGELATQAEETARLRAKAQLFEANAEEVTRLVEDNRHLRDRLRELEADLGASAALDALRAEHKQTRLALELAERRLEELEEVARTSSELRTRLEDLAGEAAEAGELRLRLRALEAKLFALGHVVEDRVSRVVERASAAADGLPIGVALSSLSESAGLRTVVVADSQGLLVARHGEGGFHEEAAAVSGLLFELSRRAREFLPMDRIRQVLMLDDHEVTLSCRFFESQDGDFSLTSLGPGAPPGTDLVDQTVDAVAAALSL